MTLEDSARKLVETMLVEIHWQGVKSTHADDLKWLKQRVETLFPTILPILDDVVRKEKVMLEEYFRKQG